MPYYDRAAIEAGALSGRRAVLAWAADPVELFFLQIQGSGRLRLPDGGIMRIGYDSQNGRDYTGIGALMLDRGLLAPGQASMQGIVAWLRDASRRGPRDHAREQELRVLPRAERPAARRAGAAGDRRGERRRPIRKFVPLGAPVFLSMDRADATGLWVAQDTGGAIKGATASTPSGARATRRARSRAG